MKNIIVFISLLMCGVFIGCKDTKTEEIPAAVDYISQLKTKDHIAITDGVAELCFDKTSDTRSANSVSYQISAKIADATVISYLYIDKLTSGYLFEHYTEDRMLIMSMQCDDNLNLEDIYLPEIPESRGFRFWWGCTQQEYYKTKKQFEENDSMLMDFYKDLLPMSVVNATLSGLYCMGQY